jgi:hypothetical protein
MVPRQIGAAKSGPDNSAYDDSAQRQIGAKTNRRNDKSALMSNNQNIKYQQSAQNEEARFLASQSASKLQVL